MREVTYFEPMKFPNGHLFSQADEEGNAVRNFNKTIKDVVSPDNNTYAKYLDVLTAQESQIEEPYILTNTALYSPICYFPQAVCVFVTKILGANILTQLFAARIGNFLVSILLIYFAIQKMPFKKMVVLLIAFLPLSLNELASCSSDALTNAITLFFIAYIFGLKYDTENKITRKDYLILSLSTLVLSMCKIVYMPMCILLFCIPESKFNSKKEKYFKMGGLFTGVVILNLAWLVYASRFLVEINVGSNSSEQIKYILSNPLKYCIILVRTLHMNFQTYYLGLTGSGIAHLNTGISSLFQFPLILLLGIFFVTKEEKEEKIDWITKMIVIMLILGIVLLIFTSLYIQWTPVYNGTVTGIQARYFIPILLLIPLAIQNQYFVINQKISYRYVLLFIVFLNLHAITCIIDCYM